MAHYFTNDTADKRIYDVAYNLGGREFRFVTADGVFSKGHVDRGTQWLIAAVLPRIGEGCAIDLGCGYGALGIVLAAMVRGLEVLMVDVNIKAVELANINAAKNGAVRARAEVGDGLSGFVSSVDYVVTNPPFRAGKAVVLRMFKESLSALKPGGQFFAVLRKQQGAESYIRALMEIFDVEVLLKKKGYVVVRGVKVY